MAAFVSLRNWSKINVFVETLIKSMNYCQTVALDHLLMYIVKTVCQASVSSFLT